MRRVLTSDATLFQCLIVTIRLHDIGNEVVHCFVKVSGQLFMQTLEFGSNRAFGKVTLSDLASGPATGMIRALWAIVAIAAA